MSDDVISLKERLTGENAFYNQKDYVSVTEREMGSTEALDKPAYTLNIESKVRRVAKDIFSLIIFPVGLYRLSHMITGMVIFTTSLYNFLPKFKLRYLNPIRERVSPYSEWKVKRISVKVDGNIIDGVIMGRPSTFGNGRWMLVSNGNCAFYEDDLCNSSFRHILSEVNGNVLVFNYPGIGASTGMPNRSAVAKAYRAMLNLLEDKDKGIGAKEIIGYGLSIGGGVQGDALRSHQLKERIKYLFVKDRTFSDLKTEVSLIIKPLFLAKILSFFIRIFGWNMSPLESSKKLKAPEIIMQRARVVTYTDIGDQSGLVIDDGVIPSEASLAKKLLEVQKSPRNNQYFMGIHEGHNDGLLFPKILAGKIEEMLGHERNHF